MKFHIPIRLPSLANLSHSCWQRLASLSKKQKKTTASAMLVAKCNHGQVVPAVPVVVTITRIGPRKLDDDNLASACKYVRDAIASKIGIDDGSDEYTWVYKQCTGKYGVDVEISPR